MDLNTSWLPFPLTRCRVLLSHHRIGNACGMLKCHMFLAGLQHFKVLTDHNPLIPILNNHRLDEIEVLYLQRLHTHIMITTFLQYGLLAIQTMHQTHCLDILYQTQHPTFWTSQSPPSQKSKVPSPIHRPVLTLRNCIMQPRMIQNTNS